MLDDDAVCTRSQMGMQAMDRRVGAGAMGRAIEGESRGQRKRKGQRSRRVGEHRTAASVGSAGKKVQLYSTGHMRPLQEVRRRVRIAIARGVIEPTKGEIARGASVQPTVAA